MLLNHRLLMNFINRYILKFSLLLMEKIVFINRNAFKCKASSAPTSREIHFDNSKRKQTFDFTIWFNLHLKM